MKILIIYMKVKVKYFASLKEHIGRSEDLLELSAETSVNQLWQQVSSNPELSDTVKTAINMEYVDKDTMIKDGDEVAFFPPVTGG